MKNRVVVVEWWSLPLNDLKPCYLKLFRRLGIEQQLFNQQLQLLRQIVDRFTLLQFLSITPVADVCSFDELLLIRNQFQKAATARDRRALQ